MRQYGSVPTDTGLTSTDPRTIGSYQVLSRLGAGNQGVVYLAVGLSGERVAIKRLQSGRQDEKGRRQFVKEVAAARLVAPFCTAQLVDAQLEGPEPYIVSEYIDGPSLDEKIRRDGPMTGATLQRLAIGTVTALAAIHEAGVVHRDFKPANVMLSPDGPRVIDFGIARNLAAETTLSSKIFGTPAFMSPEQLHDEAVGPATDVFAWASVIAFAATGRVPFEADHMMGSAYRIVGGEPTLDGVPGELLPVLERCLDKDPDARPTAPELLAMLLGRPGPEADWDQLLIRGSRLAEARTAAPLPRIATRAGRASRRRRAALAAVVVAVLAAVGLWSITQRASPASSPAAASLVPAAVPSVVGTTARPVHPSKKPSVSVTTSPQASKTLKAAEKNPPKATPKASPAKPAPTSAASSVVKSATGTGTILGLADKCLDVSNAQSTDGTVVQLTTCNQTKAQIWNAAKDGTIQALGKCLTVAAGVVEIDGCDGGGDQAWRIASGVIVNTGSGDCLAVLGGDSADLTPTVVNKCSGAASQAWSLQL